MNSLQFKNILKKNKKILLAFSCGKDSLATWLHLRKFYPDIEIYPYYCYLIKGLSFVEEAIIYYEKFFNQKIIQIPHESVFRMIDNAVFQCPKNLIFCENNEYLKYDYNEIRTGLGKFFGIKNPYVAVGINKSDSLMRRIFFKKHGDVNENQKKIFPIAEYERNKIYEIIISSGIKLPKDYLFFGRSFDGFDYRFSKHIKENFPNDYEKIKQFFPLVDVEIKRGEIYEAHKNKNKQN